MHSVVGVFSTREAAQRAVDTLNLPGDRISVVAPRPDEPEDTGIGSALGGTVGGAVGAAAGSALGTAVASLMLPGVGPVIATGIVAALVLGAGGAAIGASAGTELERATEPDPAHDPHDLFFYHEALRRGRAVLVAIADTREQAGSIRSTLARAGAESLDVTREAWWREVRESERAAYAGSFLRDEQDYRGGFEAALQPSNRGKSLDEHANATEAYRKGYERGYAYLQKLY